MTTGEMVRTFQYQFMQALDNPTPSLYLIDLERRLISEEFQEVMNEFSRVRSYSGYPGDEVPIIVLADLLKELADLVYVCHHAANTFGMDLDGAIKEVHISNMSKLGEDGKPVLREDGKVLKGPNYRPANVYPFVVGA